MLVVPAVLNPINSCLYFDCVWMWGAAEDGFSREIMERTQRHLDQYAREGLRTLCVAKKVCLYLSLPLFATFIIFCLHTALKCLCIDVESWNKLSAFVWQVLEEQEYKAWLKRHEYAETSIENREELLLESAERLETNLTLLGEILRQWKQK